MIIWQATLFIIRQTSLTTEQADKLPITERQKAEGRDERDIPENDRLNYQVPADQPKIISIADLRLTARVLPMSTNPDASVQAPININDSGWFTKSAKPNSNGAVLIDGHASGPTREGLFAYIDTLRPGAKIILETGNGDKYHYEVKRTESIDLNNIDMNKVMTTVDGASQGLNLITCAGEWINNHSTFSNRVVVYSTLSSIERAA